MEEGYFESQNRYEKGNGSSEYFSFKNLVRALTVVCIIMVFCPTFLVSCSGQTIVKFSAWKLAWGISDYGTNVDPSPIVLLSVFLPLTAFIILFVRQIKDKIRAIIVLKELFFLMSLRTIC